MARLTIKNEYGKYSALCNGYGEGKIEEERLRNDLIQKLGQFEDICEDPALLAGIFLAKISSCDNIILKI